MCSAFQLCAGRMLAEWKCLISSSFQEFPHKRISLFCHCSIEPIMSVTLSAGVFSLLPAAVGFSSHKDSICWVFDGKPNETGEIQHGQGRDSVVSNSPHWGLFFNCTCLDFFSSNWSPKHAGGLSWIVLREHREQGKETTEDGGRCFEAVIPNVQKKPSW